MTNQKSTKRALVASVLVLALCFSMLVGTTFAWFTDSVTSANNIIQSGNLDVELYYQAEGKTTWTKVDETTNVFKEDALWEPGYTEVIKLKVVNAGSLALKYQLGVNVANEVGSINVNDEPFKLSSYIKYGIVEGDQTYTRDTAVAAVDATAKALKDAYSSNSISLPVDDVSTGVKENEVTVTMVVYMPTSVGNDANAKKGAATPTINLGINVVATQLTSEEDSFGNDYDKESVVVATSPAVTLPQISTEATEQTVTTAIKNNVTLKLPAEFISNLAQMTDAPESVALSHAEPKIDTVNNMITFDHIELIDENGDIIDLEALGNDKPITVKFNVGDAFNVGDIVIVYHDGEIFATTTVDADKNITYTATHFCEVTVGYNDGKIDNFVELENTVKHAEDDDTIVFGGDITSEDGILINNKNLTVDLNGYTFAVSEGASTSSRAFKIIGTSVVTVKNGTIIAAGSTESGTYGTVRTEGSANVTLENLNLYNYRGGGLNIKVVTGTTVTINNCKIYSQYGGGVEASGGNIVLNNTKIEQKGVYGNGWYSVAIEINGGGKVTVNSGEYFGSAIATDSNASMGNSIVFILNSGGTIDIYGGTFNGVVAETAAAANFCGLIYADTASIVNIYGGTFNSNGAILDMRNNAGSMPNPTATIYGGTFSADPTVSGLYSSNLINLADGCEVIEGNDTYVVGKPVATADELKAALADNAVVVITKNIEDATIKLPRALKNVTIKALSGVSLINTTVMSSDGNSLSYEGLTFDGVTFDNSNIVLTGMRSGSVIYHDLTITNCTFKNIERASNYAAVHMNMSTKEAVKNFTFTNNVIDGVTGSSNNALTLKYVTGNITISNNVIKNVALYPFNLMIANDDGIDDNAVVENNVFAGSKNGRLQGVGANAEGNDTVNVKVNNNVLTGITETYQICFWQFNAEKTTVDFSMNYYDVDIEANPGKIYYNSSVASVDDLKEMGVYPFYTELNEDGTINKDSLVEA